MNQDIASLDELKRMKKKMEQTWGELFERTLEEDGGSWSEELPKFEGIRRTSKLRLRKAAKFH